MLVFPSEPSESPINVTILPTNASTVIVSWVPPAEEDRNGVIQGYTVRVVGVHTEEDFTLSVSTTETVIGGLHPFYSYKFTVATVTISHGPFSNPVTIMMPPLGKAGHAHCGYVCVPLSESSHFRCCTVVPLF